MSGLEFTRNQKLALVAIVGVAAIAFSTIHIRNSNAGVIVTEPSDGARVRVTAADSDPLPGSSRDAGFVIVHVAGCVNAPNVYKLPDGKRVIDAVNAAGGARCDADLQAINLAAKLEDGAKIEVPSKQIATPAPVMSSAAPAAVARAAIGDTYRETSSSNKLKTPGEGLIHINSADIEQLQRLPGVGPSTAEKIIEYRKQIGRFTQPEQMLDVKGIGPKKFEKMRPFVAL